MADLPVSTDIDAFMGSADKAAARTSLELGSTDTVEFGAFIPPAGTTAEIDAVTTATVGQVMLDTDKNRNVVFITASTYEEIGAVQFNNEIHISKNGSDTRTGLSPYDVQNPFLTFVAAIAAASTGDVIIVHAGNYDAEGAVDVADDLTFNFLDGSVGTEILRQTVAGKTLKAIGSGSLGGVANTAGSLDIQCNVLGSVNLNTSASFSNCSIQSGSSPHALNLSIGASGQVFQFRNCRIKATATNSGGIGIADLTYSSSSDYIVENCVIEANGTGSCLESNISGTGSQGVVVLNTYGNTAVVSVTQQVESMVVDPLITAS